MNKEPEKIDTSIEDDIEPDSKDTGKTDLRQVSELLMDGRYRRRKTILTDRQITKLTTLDVVAQIYDIEFLKNWVNFYAEWRTSGGGKGRQDIVDITKFSYKKEKEFQSEILSLMRGK